MNFKILFFVLMLPLQTVHARFFIDGKQVAVADRERWYPLFKPVEPDLKTPLNHQHTGVLLATLDQRFGTTGAREILQILKNKFGNAVPRLTPLTASELLFRSSSSRKSHYRIVPVKDGIEIFESPTAEFPQGQIKKIRLNTSSDQLEIVSALLEQALKKESLSDVVQKLESLGNSYEVAKDLAQKLNLGHVAYRMVPQKMALQVAETPSPMHPHGRLFTLAYAKPAGMDEDFEGAGRNMILAVQAERLLSEKGWSVSQLQSEIKNLNEPRPYQLPEVPMNFFCQLMLQSLPAAE